MMEQSLLKQRAAELEDLLYRHSAMDTEVAQLLMALTPLLSAAKDGKINAPVEWREVPGSFYFSEGNLRKYRDIEAAYAAFKIKLTGGEPPALKAFREKMNYGKK